VSDWSSDVCSSDLLSSLPPPPVTVRDRLSNCSRWLAHGCCPPPVRHRRHRSEEHTSELQSLTNLVCRLLLEKKKKKKKLRNRHDERPIAVRSDSTRTRV